MEPSASNAMSPDDDAFSPAIDHGKRTHLCYAAMMEHTSQAYMESTSKFVATSTTSNNYILIVYDYDSNGILAVPLKTCLSKAILEACQTAHMQLCTAGLCPKLQHLDNEASCALQDFMIAEHVDFQLVPPHVHHCNAAECAICTFKNHFIAAFAVPTNNFQFTCGIASSLRPS